MIRILLATTALTAAMSGAALAQNTAPATPNTAPMAAPNATMTDMSPRTLDMAAGYTYVDTDSLASRIIGQPIYTGTGNDADNIGDVNDLVIGEDGSVAAVIIGVGGFLGIGEKQVAVNFGDLDFTTAADNTERWVLNTSREALESAPEFQWVEDDVNGSGAGAPAPMTQNAPMTQPAPMAPATNPPPAAPMAPATPAPTNPPAASPTPNAMAPAPEPMGAATGNSANNANNANTTTAFDRSTLTSFDESTITAQELIGTSVYDSTDERVGEIGDFVLNQGGDVDAVIVDVGGFLGIGEKPVAVGFDDLNFQVDASNNRYLLINATREQLDAQPAFNRDTYLNERDTQRLTVAP